MYLYSNILEEEKDMGQRIVKTQSVFGVLVSRKKVLLESTHNI